MAGRFWLGALFLVLGVGFFMHQADILDFTEVLFTWWPLVLMMIGIVQLINRTYSSAISGLMFILVGGLFLANQLFDLNITAFIWPIILIFIGLVFIFTRFKHDTTKHTGKDLNSFSLFSGTDMKSQAQNFRGGSVTAIIGGAEIDLREVVFAEEGATLELTTVFGGIEITVPENVQVENHGIPIFAGWEDSTKARDNNGNLVTLKVNGFAVFGGVEIKN